MMEVLAYLSLAYLAVRLVVVLANLFSRPFLPKGKPRKMPRISVLIPARNEEANIGALLDDLGKMNHRDLQILVYDDDSNDRTAEIISEHSRTDSRVRCIKGNGPPEGWLGKNFACDRLAREADGEYLLFLDADVRVNNGLLPDSIAFMEKHVLSLLSVFPVQSMKSMGEWITVPLMNRILIGNLPLFLVRKSHFPGFSAANGQFMLFKAESYNKHRFHEEFKNEKVEDIRIIRKMKKLQYKVSVLLSDGQVSCRMYTGFHEGLAGFSKNIHAFFGKNWLILFIYNVLTMFGPFAVWMTFSWRELLLYTIALIVFSALVSVLSKQSVWRNILFMPVQQISVLLISILAAYKHLTGNFTWKERKIFTNN